ncbi:hypothetical protein EGI22_00065 [Lacihabitans sp. LS3-19]|nr:hypothetical protein [Lacihabitans sp. LS3-19]
MIKFKIKSFTGIIFLFLNIQSSFCQNSEIGIREYYRYYFKFKGIGNQFASKNKYPGNQFSTEINFQKQIFNSENIYPYLNIKFGGGLNLIRDGLFFQTKNSNDNKIIWFPFILNSFTITPIKLRDSNVKFRSEVYVPIKFNHLNKYFPGQFFPIATLGYSLIFNSRKVLSRLNIGFSSNITPCLLGKDDIGIKVQKFYRNSFFLSVNF